MILERDPTAVPVVLPPLTTPLALAIFPLPLAPLVTDAVAVASSIPLITPIPLEKVGVRGLKVLV